MFCGFLSVVEVNVINCGFNIIGLLIICLLLYFVWDVWFSLGWVLCFKFVILIIFFVFLGSFNGGRFIDFWFFFIVLVMILL